MNESLKSLAPLIVDPLKSRTSWNTIKTIQSKIFKFQPADCRNSSKKRNAVENR